MNINNQKYRAPEKSYFYNTFADQFDSKMNMYDTNKRLHIIFNQLLPESLKGKSVLDAGCGTGWFSKKAEEQGAKVTSLDIGYNLLRIVRNKCDSTLVSSIYQFQITPLIL